MKNAFLFAMLAVVVLLAILLSSKSPVKPEISTSATGVVERVEIVNPTTGSVTTEVRNLGGTTIYHDRRATWKFVPAKSGTNNEVATSGPISQK